MPRKATNFVNNATNTCWLSGYARRFDGDTLLLYQSANPDRAIPITLPKNVPRRPADNEPIEVHCHAFGWQDDQGRPRVRLQAIKIKRPSVAAIPSRTVWASALNEEQPFVSMEELRKMFQTKMELNDLAIEAILIDAKRNSLGGNGFLNKAIVSGFVGTRAFVPPQTDGGLAYLAIRLHQHADEAAALPVRVYSADRSISERVKPWLPVNVAGEIFVEVERDADGAIVDRRLSIRCDKHSIGSATAGDFAGGVFPAWWTAAINQFHERKRAAADAAKANPAAVRISSSAVEEAVMAAPVPAGVTDTDDEI